MIRFIIILFILTLSFPSHVIAASLVHSEDFEDNNRFITYGGTTDYQATFTNGTAITTSSPHGGTYSMRFNLGETSALDPIEGFETEVNPHANIGLSGADYGNTSGFDCAGITTGEIYVSYWFKYDEGDLYKLSHQNHKVLYMHNTVYADNVILGHRYSGNLYLAVEGDADNTSEYELLDQSTPPIDYDDGEWHQEAIWVKYGSPNTADGEIKYWVDGTLLVDETGIQFITTTDERVHYFELSGNHAEIGGVVSVGFQIDDIEVWDGLPSAAEDPTPTINGCTVTGMQ
jgi:hypothetical protein